MSVNHYGVYETNPITEADKSHSPTRTVYWDEPGLYITRFRIISDPGFPFWDVSYCNGTLNGEDVDVQLPFSQLPKRNMVRTIIAYAKRDGVYAKGLGILDNMSKLI